MPSLYHASWIFLIYAFLGWCTEVAYQAMSHGRFINRGFLNGPVCPIYGFGLLIVVAALTPLQESKLALFIGATLLTSALEFITGFLLEKLFHARWWDYSHSPCNIMGYVCLKFSIMWGLACMLVMDAVHPALMRLLGLLPERLGMALLALFFSALIFDLVLSVLAATKLSRHIAAMDELTKRMRVVSDGIGEPIAERAIELKDRLEEKKPELDALRDRLDEKRAELDQLKEKLDSMANEVRNDERRLLQAFPEMQGRHLEGIYFLRERQRKLREEREAVKKERKAANAK